MFREIPVAFKDSVIKNRLITDYINALPALRQFYGPEPTLAAIAGFCARDPYPSIDRGVLVNELTAQASTVDNTSEATLSNIRKLADKSVYTVTTGHQLCLFTGPLYFVYKILSTVALADNLRKEAGGKDFVPVYWLAGEDHDFNEVNHFRVAGKEITWNSPQTGPVGWFSTDGLSAVKDELQQVLGSTGKSKKLLQLFNDAYLRHKNLSDATRYLVNALFGEMGIVVIDPSTRAFKQKFSDAFSRDIFDHVPQREVGSAAHALTALGYDTQVNPREINVFYIDKGVRGRIVSERDRFAVSGTELSFSHEEMKKLVASTPEKLSPNVMLRPLYQQTILPNVAYVGGPGEIAYWLEYKAMFDKMQVVFPALVLRDSFTLVDKQTAAVIKKLGIGASELFGDEQSLTRSLQAANGLLFGTGKERSALEDIMRTLAIRVKAVDPTLEANAEAEKQRMLKRLEAIEKKANRALKRKAETSINRLFSVREKILPAGIPQERIENISTWLVQHGEGLLNAMREHCNPLRMEHKILVEE